MAERRSDNWVPLRYPMLSPTMDRRSHPAKVVPPSMVRAFGVDGRFVDSARSFPPFKKVLDLKASPFTGQDWSTTAAGGTGNPSTDPYYFRMPVDNSGMTQIWFAKYLVVQVPQNSYHPVSTTARTLRGFAVAHNYLDGATLRGAFRFYFYDPTLARWAYHDFLREVSSVTPSTIHFDATQNDSYAPHKLWPYYNFLTTTAFDSTSTYDVASAGNFIYFSIQKTPSGSSVFARSIFCAGLGIAGAGGSPHIRLNSTSSWHVTALGAHVGQAVGANFSGSTDIAITTSTAASTAVPPITGKIGTGYRWQLDAKNVEGPLRAFEYTSSAGTEKSFRNRFTAYLANSPSAGQFSTPSANSWGLNLRLRSYRTLDTDLFDDSGGQVGVALGGTLFREDSKASETWVKAVISGNINTDYSAFDDTTGSIAKAGAQSDAVVVSQVSFDPTADDIAYGAHRVKLILPYQGTMIRVGSVPQPENATIQDRDEVLSWGALNKFAPEQSRIADSTPLGASQDEQALALISAGDYVFVVGDTSVFRIHRNGNLLAINEIQSLAGGVGRFAAVGVGTALAYTAPNGVYLVEGSTGEFQLVSALDRLISQDWRASLSSIKMGYDMILGCLILLNTTTQEAVLLWNNTGFVTSLKDIPFQFIMNGVDPVRLDLNRSFWMDGNGKIFTVNTERSTYSYDGTAQGAFSICGGDPAKLWNVSLKNTSTTTSLRVDSTTGCDSVCVGFKVYVRTGLNQNQSSTITAVSVGGGETIITISPALPNTPAAGDLVSIAPNYFELIAWPVGAEEGVGVDTFSRKIVRGMSHHINLLAGDTTILTNVNLYMEHLIYQRANLTTPVAGPFSKVLNVDQTHNSTAINYAGSVLYPSWRCLASDLDLELVEGIVDAVIGRSESETTPQGP